jgi:hypothetical protein
LVAVTAITVVTALTPNATVWWPSRVAALPDREPALPSPYTMLTMHADKFEQVATLWRMLCNVPIEEFQPVACYLNGKPVYTIIRTDDDQQTSQQIEMHP